MTKYASAQQSPVYLIDASIYIFRAYFALPDAWHSEDGWPTEAIYGYAKFLLDLLEKERPTRIAAAYDESLGSCFRNDLYPGYKSSRALPDESLAFQLEGCKVLAELLGIHTQGLERFEADDIIASWARLAREQGVASCIISRDKDLGQLLVEPGDSLWDFYNDKRLTLDTFEEKVGVTPQQFVDYQALVGDKVDDIPGVPGIGPKTAAQLLGRFHSLDQMLAQLPAVAESGLRGAKGLASKLGEYHEQILMARELVKLADDAPVEESLEAFNWKRVDETALLQFGQQMGLGKGIMRRFETLILSQQDKVCG